MPKLSGFITEGGGLSVDVELSGFDAFNMCLERSIDPKSGVAAATTRRYAGKVVKELYDATPVWAPKEEGDQLPRGRWRGELRAGWVGGSMRDPKSYGESLPLRQKASGGYDVEIENTCYWAAWVEYGHMQHPGQYAPPIHKRLSAESVEPTYFMTNTLFSLEQTMQEDIGRICDEELRKRFK